MTASAAEDVDSDAAAHLNEDSADAADGVAGFEDAPASADDAQDRVAAADPALDDSDAADDDADGTFSLSSPAWSSSSWDSSTDSTDSSSAGDSSAESSSSDSSHPDSSPSPASPSSVSFSSATREDVPLPADQIGKTRSDASTIDKTPTGKETTRAYDIISASLDTASSGTASERDASSAADRLGAAAAELGSRLDLNGKLDRGRQVWRQAMTGPNNWLSTRTSSSPSDAAPTSGANSRSVLTPARDSSAASGYFADRGSGSASYGGPAPAGYGSSAPSSSTSYGGPVAGSAPAAGGTSSSGSAAAGTGRPGTGSSGSSWNGRATVGAKAKRKNSRRQAQLTLSRIEPWSVMKFSFVVSVVAFIVLFVAVALLYMVVSSLGVFDSLQHTISTLTGSKGSTGTNVKSWFSESRVLGYTGMLGALNIVLITALSTIGAVIYNLIAQAFGGIEVTLRETE
jgi:hypothetical protein